MKTDDHRAVFFPLIHTEKQEELTMKSVGEDHTAIKNMNNPTSRKLTPQHQSWRLPSGHKQKPREAETKLVVRNKRLRLLTGIQQEE